MPPPEDSANQERLDESSVDDMRLYGIVNSKHTVQIELGNKIVINVDEENSPIIDAAKDSFTLINNRFLPKIKAWIEIINKAEGDVNSFKEALMIKNQLESAIFKYHRLDIKNDSKNKSDKEDEVSSDSDLEEVPEMRRTSKMKTSEEIDFLSSTLGVSKKEKEVQITKQKEGEMSSDLPGPSHSNMSERKKKLLEVAPKVPFDIDLYHWEDEKLPTPTILAVNSEGSRFWGGGTSEELTEIPVPDGAASLRTRVIEYVGKWEPINHTCRAPLPSGKLCPRKDRVKCPHHGLIVERDDKGQIINKEDEEKVTKSKPKPDVPDWQDPKLLAEIKAQTGVDLKMPEKGKRAKKKKKYPGLTDIKEIKDTPSKRISKKIFNKKSLKRVAETLDKIDHKKHRDKFGDQFNYVHGT